MPRNILLRILRGTILQTHRRKKSGENNEATYICETGTGQQVAQFHGS